jgi:hypothetical protein
MATTKKTTTSVLVTGDLTVDWNIARNRDSVATGAVWNQDDYTRACMQPGGAALLGDLIEGIANQIQSGQGNIITVCKDKQLDKSIPPCDQRYHHSYSLWSSFKNKDTASWRVSEFIGMDRNKTGSVNDSKSILRDVPEPDVVVIDDANLGFRDQLEYWTGYFDALKKAPWIIIKMSCPVADGKLWKYLHQKFAKKIIVVMNVDDVRRTEVQISKGLSWERTAQDLAWELIYNPRINSLADCAGIVVSFDTAGAFHLSERKGKLFYDSKGIEGTWAKSFPGGMIGYNSCLTASLVHRILLAPENPDIIPGIQSGIAAMRKLHIDGYGDRNEKEPCGQLTFPIKSIATEIASGANPVAVDDVEDPVRFLNDVPGESVGSSQNRYWTILENRRKTESLDSLAEKIVYYGEDSALSKIPVGKFGFLTTADRREIESFRSISSLITEYCNQKKKSRPLSIGVFGAPGSGKSFGITEVANSLEKDLFKRMEFNLSQFRNVSELHDALHQVRDVALSGSIPLVFWDEFDAVYEDQPLGWLKHFLAPMQDGNFRQGQILHSIGPAIFIFAGGTSESFELFGQQDVQRFREVKGTDFISRLKGFINIMGPNPVGGDPVVDPYYVVRRAILLRSLLSRAVPQLIDKKDKMKTLRIDSGVLSAFLQVKKFKHGARSMENIITMSQLSGKNNYERSCLPPESLLNLHVDGLEFLSLVQQIVLTPEILERLAEAAHQVYCEGKKRDGWKLGPEKNEKKKTHPWLIPYEQLPESAKNANRVTVKLIPKKLAAAGYVMVPARSNQKPLKFPGDDIEILARLEHSLWMQAKLTDGFKLGKPTADDPKKNEYLVEWDKLSEKIKTIDRDLVKGIPTILARAGYAVEKLQK